MKLLVNCETEDVETEIKHGWWVGEKNGEPLRSFRGNGLERRLRRVFQIKDFGFGSKSSGQIIATSHDLTSNGGLVREIPLFQGNQVGEIL